MEIKLTNLEKQFMSKFIGELYAEEGFSDVDVNSMSKVLGMSVNIIKGILGSLTKKGLVHTQDNECGFDIIYLDNGYYWMHPEWKNS